VAIKKWNTVIYTPPQWEKNIRDFLSNLEVFMNNDQQDIDPLIKLWVIHYQFESIHPFSDGNWRTWRILMILYLILTKKLEYPVLFLSEFINTTRSTYYTLLNKTNQSNDYTWFILYILEAIIKQSNVSATKIIEIQNLMKEVQQKLASENLDYHKITTTLFSYPFISVSNLWEKIGVSRQTMTRYIPKLENTWLISTSKVWRSTLIYIPRFITILS
jgi:Fic family protein